MEQGLTLAGSTGPVPGMAILFHLSDVPLDGFPSLDLSTVFLGKAAAHVVSAVPLEPAARVFPIDPAFLHPIREGFAGIHAKKVERGIVAFVAEFCLFEPFFWKFVLAIGEVLSSKDTEFKHCLWSEFRFEFGVEMFRHGFGQRVLVLSLHGVADADDCWAHARSLAHV